MKRLLLLLPVLGLVLPAFCAEDGTAAGHPPLERVVTMLKRLHEAQDYATEEYFADLLSIGKEVREQDPKRVETLNAATQVDAESAMLKLAANFGEEDAQRTDELGQRYGHLKPLSDPRMHISAAVQTLLPEHGWQRYQAAWEAWLMAPPSRERAVMEGNIRSGLVHIGDENSVPLLLENFRIRSGPMTGVSTKAQAAEHAVNLIDVTPGPVALDAMLECNRVAVAGGFASEGMGGVSCEVVSLLTSRSWAGNEDIDYKIGTVLEQARQLKHPGDIVPLRGEHWKVYKPLVVARLRAERLKGKEEAKMPAEDLDVLKAAMVIMPKD